MRILALNIIVFPRVILATVIIITNCLILETEWWNISHGGIIDETLRNDARQTTHSKGNHNYTNTFFTRNTFTNMIISDGGG